MTIGTACWPFGGKGGWDGTVVSTNGNCTKGRSLRFDKERHDRIVRAIIAAPARTVAGLAVKARATASDACMMLWWDEPQMDLDWDKKMLRWLIEAVCLAAGVDLPGNLPPIARLAFGSHFRCHLRQHVGHRLRGFGRHSERERAVLSQQHQHFFENGKLRQWQ